MSDSSLQPANLNRSIIIFAASLLLLIGGMWLVSIFLMQVPQTLLQRIILLMVATGILVSITSYGIHKSGILTRLRSLSWLLVLIVVFTVGVVLLNLWLLSRYVFWGTPYVRLVILVMGFAGLSALGFGYFVSRTITERLSRLANAAKLVAQGDFSTRLDIVGNDEIAHLGESFNAMARDLEQVDQQKRQLERTRRDLIAWVSHDLRTPLTSMRVMLEALADGIITDEETQTRYVKTTLTEIEHLSHLINDLFELAKLDVGGLELNFYPTPISDLLSDTLGGMQAKAQKKDIKLTGSVEDGIDLVYIAPEKIQRVLKNLIDNAIRYTPAGEHVTIRVSRNPDDFIQVDVHNTGVYINEDVLPSLFESFYRGEKSRASTDDERGAGLGLAIARGFIQAHGGHIWADSDAGRGTTFSFTLPDKS